MVRLNKSDLIDRSYLFEMPNTHIYSIRFQLRWDACNLCLTKVIWEQHFWLDDSSDVEKLLNCHGVRLVAGQESDINIIDVSHFWDIFGVAGDVNFQSIEGEYETVVTALWVEVLMTFGGVVGRNGLNGNVIGKLKDVAVSHHGTIAKHISATLVGDELGVVASKLVDCCCVEVVEMLVGYQDVVGFG